MTTTASTARTPSLKWPAQVDLRHAHERHVIADDGSRLDLDAFRDACRTQAAALREQAIAEAGQSLRAVAGQAIHALVRAATHNRVLTPRGGF